jgi:hypothetical protein
MEPQGREQADDPLRHLACYLGQRAVGRDGAPRKSIQTAPDPFELSAPDSTGQCDPGDTQRREVAWTYQSLALHQFKKSVSSRIHAWHAVA